MFRLRDQDITTDSMVFDLFVRSLDNLEAINFWVRWDCHCDIKNVGGFDVWAWRGRFSGFFPKVTLNPRMKSPRVRSAPVVCLGMNFQRLRYGT